MKKKERIMRYWVVLIVYMLLITIVSSIPGEELPDIGPDYSATVLHFFEYLLLGFLCIRAFNVSYPNLYPVKGIVYSILLSTLFAFSDEIHQYFVPGRICFSEPGWKLAEPGYA